jgi:hypothetical protein
MPVSRLYAVYTPWLTESAHFSFPDSLGDPTSDDISMILDYLRVELKVRSFRNHSVIFLGWRFVN